ncbi:unnamed protein product [Ambrosiozyma monospora]|uniref:Unnamed protein product n=1 Tax=Ambrosiozyma monospora TaxID=43982 RepID=A0A9W6YU58_AMBMO|nr:unnamed protein product [Ambrosiozyma monospora]
MEFTLEKMGRGEDDDIELVDPTELLVDAQVSDDEVMDDNGNAMSDSVTIELQQHNHFVGRPSNAQVIDENAEYYPSDQ